MKLQEGLSHRGTLSSKIQNESSGRRDVRERQHSRHVKDGLKTRDQLGVFKGDDVLQYKEWSKVNHNKTHLVK